MGKIYSRVGNIKKGHSIFIITEREIQIKTLKKCVFLTEKKGTG
jgi:hypothetical protein